MRWPNDYAGPVRESLHPECNKIHTHTALTWILIGLTRFWLGFDSVLTRFWVGFESVLSRFWVGFDSVLTRFWLGFDSVLTRFWFGFDSVLTRFWLGFDSVLTRFWLCFNSVLTRFWLGFVPATTPRVANPLCSITRRVVYDSNSQLITSSAPTTVTRWRACWGHATYLASQHSTSSDATQAADAFEFQTAETLRRCRCQLLQGPSSVGWLTPTHTVSGFPLTPIYASGPHAPPVRYKPPIEPANPCKLNHPGLYSAIKTEVLTTEFDPRRY